MLQILAKAIILMLCFIATAAFNVNTLNFLFLLFAIAISAFNQYYNHKKLATTTMLSYIAISIISGSGLIFLPLLLFDLSFHFAVKKLFPLTILLLIIPHDYSYLNFLLAVLAMLLAYLINRNSLLAVENKTIQDDNYLQKSRLLLKNQTLQAQQNDALYMTKLSERNRIARDIHDNIGHSLSRALLQTGAIAAMNEDEKLQPAIDGLKITLTDSMNVIRNSIHDLKDDAIDLKSAIGALLEESKFVTNFKYDSDSNVENIVKNCFLIVLKEALTNVHKHSDATTVNVSLIEHPAMYQFLIHDNGRPTEKKTVDGIGITNIKERVVELSGYVNITTDDGYKIFITIPKKELENT